MSFITLQFGQCGNQVGHHLFSLLSRDIELTGAELSLTKPANVSYYFQESSDTWFRSEPSNQKYFANAILVDTEQKVFNDIKKKLSADNAVWDYDSKNIISDKGGGSGNNWAFGFGQKGPKLKEQILECVRKNVEKSDYLYGFFNILSSAGGTGSGVGSYMIEELRQEFMMKMIVSTVVLPYSSGEVTTQNYNTVLTLARLYDVSDMCLIFPNDHLHKMSVRLLKKENTELHDLNELIAMKIGSIFQPINNDPSLGFDDIVGNLVAHQDYKLVSIKTAPHYPKKSSSFETDIGWKTLVDHMKQTLRQSAIESESCIDWETKAPKSTQVAQHSLMQYHPCIRNVLVTRGEMEPVIKNSVELTLNDAALYPDWLPKQSRYSHYNQKRKFLNMKKFISLATNNSSVWYPINNVTEKAWKTFSNDAYMHQYKKFNIRESDFLESFAKVENIIKSYKELK